MTAPGKSAWAPAWNGESTGPLLVPVACGGCRRAAVRIVSRVVCDACGWEGQRVEALPPARREKLAPRLAGSKGEQQKTSARRRAVLEYAAAHPWCTTIEIGRALRVSADRVRETLVAARAIRRRRIGAAWEYALQEAVAC